jgi:hypothetical protein
VRDEENEYCGDERRATDRRSCIMDQRFVTLERDARRLTAEVRHITECLNGYKGFMEVLKRREEQKIKLRERLIERGITAVILSSVGAIGLLIWVGFKEYARLMLR